MEGDVAPGDMGRSIRRTASSWDRTPQSPVPDRFSSSLPKERSVGIDFFRERISTAAVWREKWFKGKTNAYRMVNGEGDFLPGLIVDRYGEIFVLQCLTAGMERLKGSLVDLLAREYHPESIYERSDAADTGGGRFAAE